MDQLDTDSLRLLLAGIGVIIIAAVYIWGTYRDKVLDFILQRGEYDETGLGETRPAKPPKPAKASKAPPSKPAPAKTGGGIAAQIDEPPPAPVLFADDFEDNEFFSLDDTAEPTPTPAPAPTPAAKPAPAPTRKPTPAAPAAEPPRRATAIGAPFLIQISIVATEDGYFDGAELRDALDDARLIYGDMGIYHRYDRDYREPLFSVASLVEPGTFPIKDMEDFECPGIILFFQPPQVPDPLAVFDDLIATCHGLALRLGGEEWDEKRQPLTREKILNMRGRLQDAN